MRKRLIGFFSCLFVPSFLLAGGGIVRKSFDASRIQGTINASALTNAVLNQTTLQAGASDYVAFSSSTVSQTGTLTASSATVTGGLNVLGTFDAEGQIDAGTSGILITNAAGNLDLSQGVNNVPQASLTNGTVNTSGILTGGGTLNSTLTLGASLISPSTGITSGILASNVQVSSIVVNAVYPAGVSSASYPNITGVGILTAGTWNATTIATPYLPTGTSGIMFSTNTLSAGTTVYPQYLYVGSTVSVSGSSVFGSASSTMTILGPISTTVSGSGVGTAGYIHESGGNGAVTIWTPVLVSSFSTINASTATTGTTYSSTGLKAQITPRFTGSKIKITVSGAISASGSLGATCQLNLSRTGLTALGTNPLASVTDAVAGVTGVGNGGFTWVDLPNTVSATTYTVLFQAGGSTPTCTVCSDGSNTTCSIQVEDIGTP